MDQSLYGFMQWGRIEGIVCADDDKPLDFMGAHKTENGYLIQAFFPDAKDVYVVSGKKEVWMEQVDEAGFFAVMWKEKGLKNYHYRVVYESGEVTSEDPYRFPLTIAKQDMELFSKGIHYEIYKVLGAHPMTLDGVEGVRFAVWAPNAVRVSVVGDFNFWDGRRNLMHRHDEFGIFELFVPGLKNGTVYKYEIKVKGGMCVLKADPYASSAEKRPNSASVVYDSSDYVWKDANWEEEKKLGVNEKKPMSVYELHLGSFKKPTEEDGSFYNYRELAVMVTDYVKKMGYTHVELLPVMEHPFDGSWGYQVTGYYAPTARYGTPTDFKYFVNYLHEKGIGVLLDWVPAHFPRDTFGLASFDGTCLYEHQDPRQGSHPHWGTLIYNYARPQVSNFLIANALYWAEQFHIDGIRIDAVASMLYLDYGKQDGGWVANKYGGRENLDAVELFHHLNSMMKKRNPGVIMIAEESTAWPKVTASVEDGGLGFDYKWNMGWMNDFINYMKTDPLFRKGNQKALTFSIMYAYSERFMLVLSHDEVVHGKCSMIQKMPGKYEERFSNLRAAYGYMMAHPGKKLLFMGQDFAQFAEWNEAKSLEWELTERYESHRNMQEYYKELNKFYAKHPAMYEGDYLNGGFEWIDCQDADHSIVTFLRRSENSTEQILVVCNFTPETHTNYRVGVPFSGKYKEIFNSQSLKFGGSGEGNPRTLKSENVNWNNRGQSITMTIPGLSVMYFSCTPDSGEAKPAAVKAEKPKKEEKPATAKAEKPKKAEKPATAKAEKPKKAEKPATAKAEKPKKAEKPATAKAEKPKKAVKPAAVKAQQAKKAETAKKNIGKGKTK